MNANSGHVKSHGLSIINRRTRYMWVSVNSSKQLPIDFCKSILDKYKVATTHCTVICDQGELATSMEFNKMLVDLDFTLEVAGSGKTQNKME